MTRLTPLLIVALFACSNDTRPTGTTAAECQARELATTREAQYGILAGCRYNGASGMWDWTSFVASDECIADGLAGPAGGFEDGCGFYWACEGGVVIDLAYNAGSDSFSGTWTVAPDCAAGIALDVL